MCVVGFGQGPSGCAVARADHRCQNVRVGSISTELGCPGHVRFTPGSDRIADIPEWRFRAKLESPEVQPQDLLCRVSRHRQIGRTGPVREESTLKPSVRGRALF
jgi:hypothetical protein